MIAVRERAIVGRREGLLMCGDRAAGLVQKALLRLYARWYRIDPVGVSATPTRAGASLAAFAGGRPDQPGFCDRERAEARHKAALPLTGRRRCDVLYAMLCNSTWYLEPASAAAGQL
ncbi:hypothetical protein [Amycolatopsis sp. NBC_00438]|uniref:hypothetical protein n=1 Tax=Amycolatopsis sp. NBC_00438 TaxID=2903558 RepID=UPI003FA49FBA